MMMMMMIMMMIITMMTMMIMTTNYNDKDEHHLVWQGLLTIFHSVTIEINYLWGWLKSFLKYQTGYITASNKK
jgi:hypothetical protein